MCSCVSPAPVAGTYMPQAHCVDRALTRRTSCCDVILWHGLMTCCTAAVLLHPFSVLYSSATGASEAQNMAYMARLLPVGFKDSFDMIKTLKNAGLGSLELFCMVSNQQSLVSLVLLCVTCIVLSSLVDSSIVMIVLGQ